MTLYYVIISPKLVQIMARGRKFELNRHYSCGREEQYSIAKSTEGTARGEISPKRYKAPPELREQTGTNCTDKRDIAPFESVEDKLGFNPTASFEAHMKPCKKRNRSTRVE